LVVDLRQLSEQRRKVHAQQGSALISRLAALAKQCPAANAPGDAEPGPGGGVDMGIEGGVGSLDRRGAASSSVADGGALGASVASSSRGSSDGGGGGGGAGVSSGGTSGDDSCAVSECGGSDSCGSESVSA
jgi:hypothetical protein